MPMVVLLVPSPAQELSLGPETLRQLAALGVADLAFLRDEQTVGLVLQGWAFDPRQSAAALDTPARIANPVVAAIAAMRRALAPRRWIMIFSSQGNQEPQYFFPYAD